MLGLFLGAICISFAPILVKAVSLGPSMIGFYRCFFGAIFLLGWSLWKFSLKKNLSVNFIKKHIFHTGWQFTLLAGVIFALDLAVWHRSVIYAGAGMGTILGNTQVFYLGLFGLIIHQEKPNLRYFVSVPIAFGGIYLLVSKQMNMENLPNYGWGIFYGLLTGVLYASYILSLRKSGKDKSIAATIFNVGLVALVAAIGLFIISFITAEWALPEGIDWLWLILLGLVVQVGGWLLITHNLPKVPVSISGLIILTQPVLATFLGALLYAEVLSGLQYLGAILTVFAIYLGSTRKLASKRDKPENLIA
jgi:drug/metabolite transporter (DMT)-like permease